MARSNIIFTRGLLLLAGIVWLSAMMTVPGNAQSAGTGIGSSSSQPTLSGAAASIVKSESSGQGPIVVPKDFSELRIEPGDLLSINVYDASEFTSSYRVDPAGEITIPLCGKVSVRGLTLPEAATRIEAALKDGQILVHPQVNVDVVQYAGQYVNVLGEVGLPGRVALITPSSLGNLLAQVGGVTVLAGSHITIRHGADDAAPEEQVSYLRSQSNQKEDSILVRPGDTVIVPRAGIVYVLGAVARPGGYVMQEDGKLNVAEALALSGGTLMQANTGGLRVIRRNPDGTVLDFPLSYHDISKGTQTPLLLQAQDIVYVPMSKVKATFSTTTGIMSAAASAAIVR
jgi:polysaccharide export outer membrane protein